MKQQKHVTHVILGVCGVLALGSTNVFFVRGDDSTRRTGTGTVQGESGSMNSPHGGNTGPTTGRPADSGSATGKVREPKQPEPHAATQEGSQQKKSSSSHAEKHSGKGPTEADKTLDKQSY